MSEQQAFKLLVRFDLRPEAGDEYYQFILGQYIPLMQQWGWQITEAWQTQWGNGPDRLVGFLATEEEQVATLLDNARWHELNEQLLEFVLDFEYKVIPFREGFQI